jgi:hypothetical protein
MEDGTGTVTPTTYTQAAGSPYVIKSTEVSAISLSEK